MRFRSGSLLPAFALLVTSSSAWAQTPVYGYTVVRQFPHDTSAFTQGLILENGALFEGTGLYGSSSLREVDLPTGTVKRRFNLSASYFGEGITIFQGRLFQLTWREQTGFVYDPSTFTPLGQWTYDGEGWGLTHDSQYLIMSDGTNRIRFLDPVSLATVRTIDVYDQGTAVTRINELEYINGEIFANIWQTDLIARIDPTSGSVRGWLDMHGLLPPGTSADVLNGIAYDAASGHLLVTGKFWPSLFEVAITGGAPANNTPTANDLSASLPEDTWRDITLVATDPDGDTLTYTIVASPSHGALSGAPPNVRYTPAPDYNGVDVFTYKANDGKADSNIATVTLSISPVDDPPPPTGTPAVSLSTTALSFGNQPVGVSSASRQVRVTNSGTAALTISGIAITGANAGDFARTTTCGTSLAAGASCEVGVTFKPTAMGARKATLSILDTAAGSPHSVGLAGSGKKSGR